MWQGIGLFNVTVRRTDDLTSKVEEPTFICIEMVVTEVELTEWHAEAELGSSWAGITVSNELLGAGRDGQGVAVFIHLYFFLVGGFTVLQLFGAV